MFPLKQVSGRVTWHETSIPYQYLSLCVCVHLGCGFEVFTTWLGSLSSCQLITLTQTHFSSFSFYFIISIIIITIILPFHSTFSGMVSRSFQIQSPSSIHVRTTVLDITRLDIKSSSKKDFLQYISRSFFFSCSYS